MDKKYLIIELIMLLIGIIIFIININAWIPMALGLILLFMNASLIFLVIGIEFIGLIYLVVYIGAICVLIIFMLILLNLRSMDKSEEKDIKNVKVVGILYIIEWIGIICIELIGESGIEENEEIIFFNENIINSFVNYLGNNSLLFLLIGLMLLLGVLLPIMLTKVITKFKNLKKQDNFNAVLRKVRTIVLVVLVLFKI